MSRILIASLALQAVQLLHAQTDTCQFTVSAQLVDSSLNLKPIPKLKILVREVNATRSHPFTTSFQGELKGDLPCGKYQVTSVSPSEFQGKSYTWDFTAVLTAGAANQIEMSVDNATATADSQDARTRTTRLKDDLIEQFKKYQGSIVTVWSEFGHGTGFFVDDAGLVLTNQHVIGPSEYISVQSDREHKIPAVLLASDSDKDIAVLWVQRSALPGTVIAPLANADSKEPLAEEGEKVFTIGSPLNQTKVITTGIVSRVEDRAIISDININHGNSGGPLFNSLGNVIGITTFLDTAENGPGISGIVRIEQARGVLEQAREKMKTVTAPSAELLLVEPVRPFPVGALRSSLDDGKLDVRPYIFEEGDYDVAILTPVLAFRMAERDKMEASHEKSRRLRRSSAAAAKPQFQPTDDLRNWAEYLGEYKAVVQIRATPKLRETFGSALTRGLTAQNGYSTAPAKMRFKADFYKMTLTCGDKEIEPIHPGKIAKMVSVKNAFVNATDATYEGFYTYPADAISPSCGEVSLNIYSEKNVVKAKVRSLSEKTINRVSEDFAPYLAAADK
jgi:S1-C subfamily serine protease